MKTPNELTNQENNIEITDNNEKEFQTLLSTVQIKSALQSKLLVPVISPSCFDITSISSPQYFHYYYKSIIIYCNP